MADRGSEFAQIAYAILVIERQLSIEKVAAEIGVSYAVLHSRLIGRSVFSADEIRALIVAIPDPRLVAYLLEGTRFVPAERADGVRIDDLEPPVPEALQRRATKVVIEATDVLEVVDAAIAGGGIDHRQEKIVLKEIGEAERALSSLRVQLANH
ncbi:hypothetical protein JNB88_16240 [Rhizobium cauense]|uniref:phage regulatory CII family protein n=1 Tax=Rhizobium cauense TaxID=1166683 RepID=UPI001C6E398E|nr:phage regulatory CII family protein [Rhizobium cauense]MBW9115193.1 hypothetical protein [Rhizobium cauense]